MNLQLPHLVFFCASLIYLGIRYYFMSHVVTEKKVADRSTIGDWSLIAFLGVAQVGLPLLLLFTPVLNWANYFHPPIITWIGTAVMSFGLFLFWRSHADLGVNWSVTLKLSGDHKVITHGVYRFVRHPMYAAFYTLAAGQALLLENWVAGFASLLAFSLLYATRVQKEEQMMIETFGEEYVQYAQRTGRVFPRLGWCK